MSALPATFELLTDLESELCALHVLLQIAAESSAPDEAIKWHLVTSVIDRHAALSKIKDQLYHEYHASKKVQPQQVAA